MQFVHSNTDTAIHAIADMLDRALSAHMYVLWLVSGGSNIPLQVATMQLLRKRCANRLHNLTIYCVDERYGAPGHADSNYAQLKKAGFKPGDAEWIDILADNLSLDMTLDRYHHLVQESFKKADYVVATCGIGADGHTAGILPRSNASRQKTLGVVSDRSPNLMRLTLTAQQLLRCNQVIVCAFGVAKLMALRRLRDNTESIEQLPAAIYHQIAHTVVYSDQISKKEDVL